MRRCIICLAQAELVDGRCPSCRMAKEASDHHMTYGKYMALIASQKREAPPLPQKNVGIVTKKCKYCGKEFPKHGGRIYCSDYCKYMYYRGQKKQTASSEPHECPVCHKLFVPKKNKKYCSRACCRSVEAQKARKARRRSTDEHVD